MRWTRDRGQLSEIYMDIIWREFEHSSIKGGQSHLASPCWPPLLFPCFLPDGDLEHAPDGRLGIPGVPSPDALELLHWPTLGVANFRIIISFFHEKKTLYII